MYYQNYTMDPPVALLVQGGGKGGGYSGRASSPRCNCSRPLLSNDNPRNGQGLLLFGCFYRLFLVLPRTGGRTYLQRTPLRLAVQNL